MHAKRVIVVGGGAAGLMAAGEAAKGAKVILIEKMRTPGRKLCITGKGRCNVTNTADRHDFESHFGSTAAFLKFPFSCYFAPDIVDFLESQGLKLVTERGGRIFPESGKAKDVFEVFRGWIKQTDCEVLCSSPVERLIIENGRIRGVVVGDREIRAEAVILATGGMTYPRTGSDGSGYALARSAGHTIVKPRCALVPLETAETVSSEMDGLNLRNVEVTLLIDGKSEREDFGEMTFASYGVTGPVVLSLSGAAVDALDENKAVTLSVDLKPALTRNKLLARLKRDCKNRGAEPLASLLRGLLPRELIPVCLKATANAGSIPSASLTNQQRDSLAEWIKAWQLTVTKARSAEEAIVTAGGVSTEEINPETMESRKCEGLYIAGELLDVQADTGGYNLQAAFSTGWLAGRCAAGGKVSPQYHAAKTAPEPVQKPSDSKASQFLPTTDAEMKARGWDSLDVILVTGDTYIDSPFIGVAVVGRVLENAGYRVGVIAQPDLSSGADISRLGEPKLFWGITAGCVDSLVANRTAGGKKRKTDDYTPGGENTRRPDRASIVYSNHIRKHFKNTAPLALGGIEASLRRVAHYDFWTDKVRKSVLFDAKADYLLYGMAERSILELADCLKDQRQPDGVRGLCYISRERPDDAIELPPFEEVAGDKNAFTEMFHTFYRNNDPVTAKRLAQRQDTRYLIQNPPAEYLNTEELDALYQLSYARDVHPYYTKDGTVRALDTIRFSVATHRGCYGECNFCAIAVHQGRAVRCRSKQSVINEVSELTKHPMFKGTIQDVGGPTANMYGIACSRMGSKGCCEDKKCLYPEVCPALRTSHKEQIELLQALRQIPGVKHVFVASGIRHDMIVADRGSGEDYLKQIVSHHVSGQLKIAPEHSEQRVLDLMGKPSAESVITFREMFYKLTKKAGKKQFLTYYMIAAHPGCQESDMRKLRDFAVKKLQLKPEQVQVFTPTPSTYSTLMYWTERNPFTGEPCFVEKTVRGREQQKNSLLR